MAIVNILNRKKEPGKIGNLVLDATLSERHQFTNQVTDFPVEDGSNISDHIRRAPEEITIEGFITESPVDFFFNLFSTVFSKSPSRITAAYEELMKIGGYEYPNQPSSILETSNSPQLVEIVTSLRTYSDMALTSLNINRTPQQGYSISFMITFKRIRKVRSESTLIDASQLGVTSGSGNGAGGDIKDRGASTQDAGKQSPKELKSIAARLRDAAPGVIEKVMDLLGLGGGE